MNLLTIAWKSVRQRSLSSTLTAFSIALGIMLMVSVLVIFGVVESTFSQRSINYDLIVGPKGSPLQ
ncbi:MAG TPA: ABC transporter permease, partial [Planctomycetaceae bacterium]|nr:ABC transporter permease [Planctomycetaceae bacterium]